MYGNINPNVSVVSRTAVLTFAGIIFILSLFTPGVLSEVVGPSLIILSVMLMCFIPICIPKVVLVGKRAEVVFFKRFLVSILLLVFLASVITTYQVYIGESKFASYFDCFKFLVYFCPMLVLFCLRQQDVAFSRLITVKILSIYLYISLFFIMLQMLYPSLGVWLFFSEGGHYKYLSSRPFGLNGSPTQSSFLLIFISFFFLVHRRFVSYFFCGVCLLLIQNKLTIVLFFFSFFSFVFKASVSPYLKLVFTFCVLCLAVLVVSSSPMLHSFVFDSNRLVESNTYTHRAEMISYLYDGLYDFKFFFTGFPDKSYWASEFGAFDMLYALLGFRFGIFFMIVFFLFVVLFSKKAFRGAELFVFLLFLIGTSGTMAGIFHTRYGVAWAWIITFCYVTSKQMRRVNDGKS